MLKKVAVTGGLSSGKSSVCRILKDLGAYVVSADHIVHQLLTPNTGIGQKIIETFGSEIFADGRIDRQALAKKVFSNPDQLHILEQIIHPFVRNEIEKAYQKANNSEKCPFFVAEIPLLFETNWESSYDIIITVEANPTIRLSRFLAKEKRTEEDFKQRQNRFLSSSERSKRSDITLQNDGTISELQTQVNNLFKQLTAS